MLMQPGSQSATKHKIERNNLASDVVRYSISFRRVLSKSLSVPVDNRASKNAAPAPKPEPPTTLVIGTSIADDLNAKLLEGRHGKAKVVKLCKRGGHINQISDLVDKYYKSGDCNVLSIKKIIVSVGTNDIRRCRNGVGHLFYPIVNLVQKLKNFFPAAKIFMQSLIPVRFDWSNPENPNIVRNVFDFNKLLLKAASQEDCWYFSMFDRFLDNTPERIPIAALFRDEVHLSKTGLSLLARSYIQIIRGRNCSVLNV